MQRVRRGTLPDASGAEAAPGPCKRPGSLVKSHRTRVPGRAVRLRWATRPGRFGSEDPKHQAAGRRKTLPSRADPARTPQLPCGRSDSAAAACPSRRKHRFEHAGPGGIPRLPQLGRSPEPNCRIPSTTATERRNSDRKRSFAPDRVGAPRRSQSEHRSLGPVSAVAGAAEAAPSRGALDPEEPKGADPEPPKPPKEAGSLAGRAVSEEPAAARRRAQTRNDGGASRGNPTAGSDDAPRRLRRLPSRTFDESPVRPRERRPACAGPAFHKARHGPKTRNAP